MTANRALVSSACAAALRAFALVLGVTPDLMLLVAGGLLLIYVVAPRLLDSSHAA